MYDVFSSVRLPRDASLDIAQAAFDYLRAQPHAFPTQVHELVGPMAPSLAVLRQTYADLEARRDTDGYDEVADALDAIQITIVDYAAAVLNRVGVEVYGDDPDATWTDGLWLEHYQVCNEETDITGFLGVLEALSTWLEGYVLIIPVRYSLFPTHDEWRQLEFREGTCIKRVLQARSDT